MYCDDSKKAQAGRHGIIMMSEEIFGAVQKLPVNGTKKQVVLQCAPLLTGIKLSNLLNVRADQKEEVFKLFEGSKICCRVLYEFRGRLSILLYRPGMLAAYLDREDVQKPSDMETLSWRRY